MDEIETIVFAAPGRDEAHRRCYGSIEASDIGQDYVICEHPPDVAPRDHWVDTHARAAAAKSEFVLVLEDDCVVNRHILYNCRTWKWPRESNFVAGWLYAPGGLLGDKDGWYDKGLEWYGTVAVLYRTAQLEPLVQAACDWMMQNDSLAWDCAISRAILTAGLGLRVHGPALAEHMIDVPSATGHQYGEEAYWFRSSRGTFKADWKRPAGHPHGFPA